MAEINKQDLISNDALEAPLILSRNLKEVVTALDQIILKSQEHAKSLQSANTTSKITKETQGLTLAQKELEKVTKQVATAQVRTSKEYQEQQQRLIALRTEQQKKNQETKNEILLTKSVGNEYQKLTIQLENARKKYKDLAASGTASNKSLKDQQKVVQDLDRKVKTIDASVGQFQRNVGNYPATFNTAASSVRSFLAAFGIVTGVALFARVLKGVIDLTREYERQNSFLRAVLGATDKEMKVLRKTQLELGASTEFTSKQVAELQTEFAKLGFPTRDIENMTKSTLDAALAMEAGLGEAAALTGATLKAFRLDSSQATRVNDVLAKSTASSALSFTKLADSMSTVAPVAASYGFTVEETVALLGELANAGFDASTAATATRNILLNLADSNGKLSKSLKEPVKDLPSLVRGLNQLNSEGIDLARTFELTDKRSVAAFATFLAGTDSLLDLNKKLEEAEGTAARMAKTVGDNLEGDVKSLSSAWEGLVLALTNGDSVFSKVLRGIVQMTTAFLRFITPVQSAAKAIREEQQELNILVTRIQLVNDDQEKRNKLIEELNADYPKFLENIDAEKVSNQQLAEQLDKANKQYLLRIALADVEEDRERQLRKVGKALKEQVDLELEIAELISRANQKIAEEGKESAKIIIDSYTDIEQAEAELSRAFNEGLISQEDALHIVNKIIHSTKLRQEAYNQEVDTLTDLEEKMKKVEERLRERLNLDGNLTGFDDGQEAAARAAIELEEQRLKVQVDLAKSIQDRVKKEIDLENYRREVLLKSAKTDKERELIILKSEQAIQAIRERGLRDIKKAQDEAFKETFKLSEFRLEQEVKHAKSVEERVEKEKKLENERRRFALLQENLSAQERQLIIEKSQAKIREIEEKGSEEILKERIDREKASALKVVEERQRILDNELARIRQAAIDGVISREEAEKRYTEAKQKAGQEIIELTIKQMEQIVMIEGLTAEERGEVEKELHRLRMQLNEEYFNAIKDGRSQELLELEEHLEAAYNIYREFFDSIGALFDSITARRLQSLELESRALQDERDKQLEKYADNQDKQDEIRRVYDAKEQQIEQRKLAERQKAARFDKATSAVQASIAGSLAVVKALPNIPLSIVVGALAATKVAAILAAPIPQYWQGTENHPGGPAIVGEKGSELVRENGRTWVTPSVATFIPNLSKGAEVIPHQEYLQILAQNSIARMEIGDRSPKSFARMEGELREIKQILKNKKEFTVQGRVTGYKQNGTHVKFIESMRNRP